jgi:hypothetical protein
MSASATLALDWEDSIEKGEVERVGKRDQEVGVEVREVDNMGVEVNGEVDTGLWTVVPDSSGLDSNKRDAAAPG